MFILIFSRQQRIAEIQKLQQASKFGDVREISAQDYVDEVNKAGKGVWVVLHLYKSGYPFVIILSPFTVNSETWTPEIFLKYCCWKSQSGVLLVEIKWLIGLSKGLEETFGFFFLPFGTYEEHIWSPFLERPDTFLGPF